MFSLTQIYFCAVVDKYAQISDLLSACLLRLAAAKTFPTAIRHLGKKISSALHSKYSVRLETVLASTYGVYYAVNRGMSKHIPLYLTPEQRSELETLIKCVVDDDYPEAESVVVVCDNLAAHGPACLYATFAPAEARRIAAKIEWHYTPEHGSWLNMAECELSVLARQCLKRRTKDIETLAREAACWEQSRNAMQVKVDWQFTAADARIKLKRLYPILQELPASTNGVPTE